ncbi:MAG: MerR family transcriptional regulator [Elainella sp.]
MLRISDFAQLSRVSPKALRLYDRLGLLKPMRVDQDNGYRFYSATQLPRLNRILVLKSLGFSLEQIGQLLDEQLTPETLRSLLRLKQTEIEQRLADDRARLQQIETRLQELEQEGKMTYDVVLKPVATQLVAATTGMIPNYDDCGPVFDRMFDRVYAYCQQQGVKHYGAGISIYHDGKLRDRDLPVEALLPIDGPIPSQEPIWVYSLPGWDSMATVVHHGPFSGLGQAYNALLTWIEQNNYRIVGSTRELYLQYERQGDPAQFVTEVQVPVEPV